MDPLQQLYPSRGARQIGQVLGDIASGNIGTPGMREKVLGEVYDNEYKLQRAREQRGAAILSLGAADNYERLHDSIGQSGLPEYLQHASLVDTGDLVGAIAAANELQARRDAAASALGGDWNAANAHAMFNANGPQALAAVEGQNLINNRFVEGGGGVTTTEQGRANIAADSARANASNAAAQAARGRLGIAQQQFALQRAGQWNPGGVQAGGEGTKPPSGYRWTATGDLEAIPGGPAQKAGGAAGVLGDDGAVASTFNDRQRAGAAMQREALLNQVSTQTKTPREEVDRILREQGPPGVAALMRNKGGRFFQGPVLGEIPFLSERVNRDITPFGESAARGQAMINDPAGPITNPDVEGARSMVPNISQPIGVQANLVETMLRLSGGGAQPASVRPQPSQRAIQALIANPGMSAEFDAKYGDGAAAAWLGQ